MSTAAPSFGILTDFNESSYFSDPLNVHKYGSFIGESLRIWNNINLYGSCDISGKKEITRCLVT